MLNVIIGICIPFLGTLLGSSMVFFLKNDINNKIEKLLLGFAAGVMISASVWSLLIPAINICKEQGKIEYLSPSIGFLFGIAFLLILDSIIPHLHIDSKKPEGIKTKLKNTTMLILAITLHNIPEGMAVGVVFASFLFSNTSIFFASAIALSIGIAIQNFPEGAIISMPLRSEGISRSRAFIYGTLSGIVEPIAAIVTIMLTNFVINILPFVLSFAAGTMIYVVVEELIPESQGGNHTNVGTVGVAIGFILMMILDIALG